MPDAFGLAQQRVPLRLIRRVQTVAMAPVAASLPVSRAEIRSGLLGARGRARLVDTGPSPTVDCDRSILREMIGFDDDLQRLLDDLRLRDAGLRAGDPAGDLGRDLASAPSIARTTSGASTTARSRGWAAWRWRSAWRPRPP